MTDAEVIALANKTIAEEFELSESEIVPKAHLIDDLKLDSLDFVDMVVVLQNAFSIKLRDDSAVREVRTVDDIHQLLLRKKNELEQDE